MNDDERRRLEADLEAARREREAAEEELANVRRRALRQRDRFEEQLEKTSLLARDRGEALARTRADLERLRQEPVVRLGRRVRQTTRGFTAAGHAVSTGLRQVMRRAQEATSEREQAPGDAPEGVAPDSAARSAVSMPASTNVLAASGLGSGRPAGLAIVVEAGDPAPSPDRMAADDLRSALDQLGVQASIVEVRVGATPSLTPSTDAAVVVSPRLGRGLIERGIVSVAWIRDCLDDWMADPRFEDHDLVLAASDEVGAAIERLTAKRALVAASASGTAGAAAIRPALEAWSALPKVAIHIGPPTWEAAAKWGDTAFARAVQRAFERRGWAATVHTAEERDTGPAVRADVALHILGIGVPPVHPGQLSLLWVISHPDRVTARQCQAYDVVFVASDAFRADLADRITTPVRSLHQATDPDRFFPDPTGPEHELLFVGNSRRVRRPILDALADTPHDLAVYGSNWKPDLLDPGRLRGSWIPNGELRRYYSSAKIVLSDHWPDMRDEGFISNRVYDALACGAFVLSDAVLGIAEEFDGGVATYERPDELEALVELYLADPDERRRRSERGRAAVLARHTFAHRVDTILATVRALLENRTVPPVPPAGDAASSAWRQEGTAS